MADIWTQSGWLSGSPPPTPYWLPQFVPGLTSGQTMRKLPTKIPSAQQWYRTPSSQRTGLEAYVNYAAGTPGAPASYEDLIDRMMSMLPQRAPSRASRWLPIWIR
jgi:hypothetical protein